MGNNRILVVEDEKHIRELIRFNLEKNGYEVGIAENGIDGLKAAESGGYDLVLLDIMLPGMDGLDVCKKIRNGEKVPHIPIIMLTAKNEEIDKVLGLELGADDYISKPFGIKELIARIKANLRRVSMSSESVQEEKKDPIVRIGELEIDFDGFLIKRKGATISLTLKEFEILKVLVTNRGRVFSREALLLNVWGYDYMGDARTVDVHIRHLRSKIGDDEAEKPIIETIRGVGYRAV